MSPIASAPTWDDASSPGVTCVTRRYEADWRSSADRRPDPIDYLPDDARLRPAALVALLRLDLALRWQARERPRIEPYRERYPELEGEDLVALLYEEYCLREEAGESLDAAEYSARFPEVAASFREVLEIHALVGNVAASHAPGLRDIPLPEAGATIAGFRLVEELGRGAFARVFRAEERDLADRSVALKVSRTGSREPQTLAQLQHTHIVPVYSYRPDPAAGLHLLCMPYLGRITLARILADPAIVEARSGADLEALVARLQPVENPASGPSPLAGRSYPRAIAWWGARLAEALQHAHERGVLHRDVKPSNILVTGDGLPMLLDFNLAQESWSDAPPAALRGTLAYMAPEHLAALADGRLDRVDARCDLYALGVVLFDCLVRGSRRFALPDEMLRRDETLRRTAEARRAEVPRLRATHPDVPQALEAVVRRCLAPDPNLRYATAAELAIDLQAAADDGPLRYAREPLAARVARWARHHRRRLALAAPVFVAVLVSVAGLLGARFSELRVRAEAGHWIHEGTRSLREAHPELAIAHFATAAELAAGDATLRDRARAWGRHSAAVKEVRDRADALFALGERLRFQLLGFGGDPPAAARRIDSALAAFGVLRDPDWTRRPAIGLLDEPRRRRLLAEVNELLFLWAVVIDPDRLRDPASRQQAVRICDAASRFARPAGPWKVLRARSARTSETSGPEHPPNPSRDEVSARACFQWAFLCDLEGREEATIRWLEQATRLGPDDYWSQFYLGYYFERGGQLARALEHYEAAVSLRPTSPWAWYNRARLRSARGDWEAARDDLDRALELAGGLDFLEARLELGLAAQALGDVRGARAAYDAIIASKEGGRLAFAARLNRAKLDNDAGALDRAWREYDALLGESPRDASARLGRALVALRLGDAAQADADLTLLLGDDPEHAAETFARRAVARLMLGRPVDAEADASDAYRRQPTAPRERLWLRTLLALGRDDDLLWLERPDDLDILPFGGPSLRADLRAAAERLRLLSARSDSPVLLRRTRAVLLSALADPEAATEASRALALAPQAPDGYLVRARIRRRAGDRRGAWADVETGLALAPAEPRLLEVRGLLEIDAGRPAAGLADLNRAIARGASATVRKAKARAAMELDRGAESVDLWSQALADDAEDPRLYLGRARAWGRLWRYDRVLSDVEQAAGWAGGNPALLTRVAFAYAACLPRHPERFPRWLGHVGRAWSAWADSARPPTPR